MNKLIIAALFAHRFARDGRLRQAGAARRSRTTSCRRNPRRHSRRAANPPRPQPLKRRQRPRNRRRLRRRKRSARPTMRRSRGTARVQRAADAEARPPRRTSRPPPSASRKARTTRRSCPRSRPTSRPARSKSSKCSGTAAAHCFQLDPAIESWRNKSKPQYVEFVRVPAMWNDTTAHACARVLHGRSCSASSTQLHSLIFREIHVNGNPLNTVDKITAFFKTARRQRARSSSKAFSLVRGGIEAAARGLPQSPLSDQSVPTMVVNGKYTTDVSDGRRRVAAVRAHRRARRARARRLSTAAPPQRPARHAEHLRPAAAGPGAHRRRARRRRFPTRRSGSTCSSRRRKRKSSSRPRSASTCRRARK